MLYKFGLYVLLFTYGFTLTYHLMGATKHLVLKDFDMSKISLGLINEIGYVIFWLLIYLLPQYIDLQAIGFTLDLDLITNAILIAPLVLSIKRAYTKAAELKHIDISEINIGE
nr:MAG TPA: hypothetical protein [Bacteriophage sp.]